MKNITKLLIALLLVLTLVFVFASCDTPAQEQQEQKQEEENPNSSDPETEEITDPVNVTFRANGKKLQTVTVQRGKTVTPIEDKPTNGTDGYYFAGWTYNGEYFDFTTPITEDITLVAKSDNIYHVTMLASDGVTELKKLDIEYNKLIDESDIPELEACPAHYHFAGWFDGETDLDLTVDTIKKDCTLTMMFRIDTYTITFVNDANDALLAESVVDYGAKLEPCDLGSLNASAWEVGGIEYDFETPVTSSFIVRVVLDVPKYTVTFKDANGSSLGKSKNITEGESARLPFETTTTYFTCALEDLLNIQENKEVVLTLVDAAAYTKDFTPNLKTDIVDKDISWNKSGNMYYMHTTGQYFSYKAYMAGQFVVTLQVGSQFKTAGVSAVFGLFVDGQKIKELNYGASTTLDTTTTTDLTLWNIPAGEHEIRFELLSTNFDVSTLEEGANANDYGLGISKIKANVDLSKVFYEVKFINDYDAQGEGTVVDTQQVVYNGTPTLPQVANEIATGEEFDGWWDEAGIVQYAEDGTRADTVWYAKYVMKKTHTLTFKNENGDVLGTSTVIHGTCAKLPTSTSCYYACKNAEDNAKVLNVTADEDIVLVAVDKSGYKENDLGSSLNNATMKEKYNVVGEGVSVFSYGTNFYKVGSYVEFTADCTGDLRVRLRDDKYNQSFIFKIYVDGLEVGTTGMVSSNGKDEATWDVKMNFDIDIPCGTHTIRIELVWADDSQSDTPFQSWSGCLLPQWWIICK